MYTLYHTHIIPSLLRASNSLGAYCESPGKPWDGPCEFEDSTCGNRTEDCHGRWSLPSVHSSTITFGIYVIVVMCCAVHLLSITSFHLLFVTHVVCCTMFPDAVSNSKHGAALASPFISCTQTHTDNLFPLRILRGPDFHISDFGSNMLIGQAHLEATRAEGIQQ
ncbi:hypothetical protein BDR03DRAFT_968244 [Suillus americanus]|nr:hypothetical protein BDR03DRAFT_968244 [Suillus americanus]